MTGSAQHHTFRFARKTEREGLPVIDDSASILRCTNKMFLADLLRANEVPTPRTWFVTRRSQFELDDHEGFSGDRQDSGRLFQHWCGTRR